MDSDVKPKPTSQPSVPTLPVNHHLLLASEDKPQFINTLEEFIYFGKSDNVQQILSIIKEGTNHSMLMHYSAEEETVLHTAIKMRAHKDVISALIDACPDLLKESRQGSELYRGQSALHIAITDGNIDAADLILRKVTELGDVNVSDLLSTTATGTRFENTVMLGELPLSVAVLTLNTKMVDKLLEYNAQLDQRNGQGDNVCHSLICYAHLYPEKSTEIMKMCEHIAKIAVPAANVSDKFYVPAKEKDSEINGHCLHIWLMKNNDGLNPLQLAARLGQCNIFKFIMELKGVYCYKNSDDGLFDVELFDVTDIDVISELQRSKQIAKERKQKSHTTDGIEKLAEVFTDDTGSKIMPTLEMIFNSPPATVFKFIHMSPLRYVISRKWLFYRWFYAIWGFLHILFMVGYTVYAVRRAEVNRQTLTNTSSIVHLNEIGKDRYVTFYLVLSLVVAILYIMQEIVRTVQGRMPWTLSHIMNCYHNGPFRVVLVFFAIVVIGDIIWMLVDDYYENYLLVCSLILGWWFLVFFLRGIRQFSFFTVMIQKILVGDMFRFSIVIAMEWVAFTTAMYIVFQGSKTQDDDVTQYDKLFVLVFKMTFGLTDMSPLFEASQPWFAVLIYVAFVLFTFVLMINSLIALMSNTCSVVSQNRDIQYRVQQLSIVLFFESIFPTFALRMVGTSRMCDWYDVGKKATVKRTRYFMEVRSLREVARRKEPNHLNTETMLESIFTTVMSKLAPEVDISDNENANISKPTGTCASTRNKPAERAEPRTNNASSIGTTDLLMTPGKEGTLNQIEKKKKRHKKKRPKVPASGTDEDEGPRHRTTGQGSNKVVPDLGLPPVPRPYTPESTEDARGYDHMSEF